MFALLQRFSALTLVTGLLLPLVPEGTIRRTAAMVAGLLMLMMWSEGLAALFHLPQTPERPLTVLAPTGTDVTQSVESAIASIWEDLP